MLKKVLQPLKPMVDCYGYKKSYPKRIAFFVWARFFLFYLMI